MGESEILLARKFEADVAGIISSVLSDKETLVLGYKLNDKYHNYKGLRADMYLEQGCAKLGIPVKTLIEIRYRLGFNTISRVAEMYKPIIDGGGYNSLIIICKEDLLDKSILYVESNLHSRIEIWDYNILQNKTSGESNESLNKPSCTKTEDILDRAKDAFETSKTTLFLGAGLSMDANLPSWDRLLEALLVQKSNGPFDRINEANSDAISNSFAYSSIITGRYIMNGYYDAIRKQPGNNSERAIADLANKIVTDRIRDALYSGTSTDCRSELVRVVALAANKNSIQQVITYNYDDLVETEISDKENFISIYDENISAVSGMKPIYHVHGYIPRDKDSPGVPVLSEKEYHKLYSRMHHWANVVQLNALYTTVCFFVGFSMTDPNQRRLLDLVRNVDLNEADAGEARHYIFMRRHKLRGEAIKDVNDEHCQEVEKMMLELGLNVIWFDEYNNLPKYLLYIIGENNRKPNMLL